MLLFINHVSARKRSTRRKDVEIDEKDIIYGKVHKKAEVTKNN